MGKQFSHRQRAPKSYKGDGMSSTVLITISHTHSQPGKEPFAHGSKENQSGAAAQQRQQNEECIFINIITSSKFRLETLEAYRV